ncbi:MAG: type II toxin-antitoxin system HicB family antitoxin [Candidatus Gracilibacteria bacterium]|nr:type II toxin-antitoxin system HicB family antitoxin [Candidatus Gracilibacteria bacterium]
MNAQDFLELPVLVEKDEDGVWVAESPYFNGFFTQGYDLKELQDNLQDISYLYFDMIKDGEKPFKKQKLINLKYNQHGEITNNISKNLDQDFEKKVIQIS